MVQSAFWDRSSFFFLGAALPFALPLGFFSGAGLLLRRVRNNHSRGPEPLSRKETYQDFFAVLYRENDDYFYHDKLIYNRTDFTLRVE